MLRNAIAGGVILALIEGLQIFVGKQFNAFQMSQMRAQAAAMGVEWVPPEEDRLEPPKAAPTLISTEEAIASATELGRGMDVDSSLLHMDAEGMETGSLDLVGIRS